MRSLHLYLTAIKMTLRDLLIIKLLFYTLLPKHGSQCFSKWVKKLPIFCWIFFYIIHELFKYQIFSAFPPFILGRRIQLQQIIFLNILQPLLAISGRANANITRNSELSSQLSRIKTG